MVFADRQPLIDVERLDKEARFRETVIMGLRMINGIELAHLEQRFGISVTQYYGKTLESLLEQGLLDCAAGRISLSAQGLPLANQVLSQLV